jgi:hypothetical protein
MRILDLYCGGGGAALGMSRFGQITGIDIEPQDDYQWNFIIRDVLTLDLDFIRRFDFIWASPPCQQYSCATAEARSRGLSYPDLVDATRELLIKAGKPYCIENVPGSPLCRTLMLCGSMFDLGVIRHRHFEINGFRATQPPHQDHPEEHIMVVGHDFDLSEAQSAMGIFHIASKHTHIRGTSYSNSCYLGMMTIRYPRSRIRRPTG